MALAFVSIGLADPKDISVRALEWVQACDVIYLENYTACLPCQTEQLEAFYGKKIIVADRAMVETGAEQTMLKDAQEKNVAFLVIGDAFSATTHIDLFMRAKELKIETKIFHNASILTAVGETGLQLYNFGKTPSIPFHNKDVTTPYDVFELNQKYNLHTLFLLDVNPEQKSSLTIHEAIQFLKRVEQEKQKKIISDDTLAVACCRMGCDDQLIISGTIQELENIDFGTGLHSLIIPAKNLHFVEEDTLKVYSI